ncbi:hypothetical protein LHK12_12130 [Providencia rettgeri]|nr:hypothetical protein [Providencia rettgeri]
MPSSYWHFVQWDRAIDVDSTFLSISRALERLYGAIFLSVITSMGLLVYNLSASNWRQILVRSYSWWPLPLFLMMRGWI